MSVILTNFIPKRREISAVDNSTRCTVTTTEDHGYFVGQFVRLHVPIAYGMVLDTIKGEILNIPSTTQFTTDVDTSQLAPYVAPVAPPSFTQSHVVPISGEELNNTSIG